ncbi:MAG: adenylate kinase [Bacteroidetes bacterium]|nr:adenylate kinase [Bacteroidota bacterium]
MMNIILFGPPGSGKGTQSAMIAEKFNLAHISTGDIFRYEIKNQTPLGIKVKTIIEKGELVPDELLIDLLRNAMDKIKDRNGFIFDGFPRTIPQAKDLDILMTEMKSNISGVVALEVDEEEIVGRLLKRAQLEGRSDDTEDVIRNRMSVYREQTEPLLDYYSGKGIVNKVNGVGSIDDIFLTLCDVIEKL